MAGKFSKTTTPGQGYTDAVTRDERRAFSEEREDNFVGSADPTSTPPGLEAGAASASEDADTESDEAPSGRVQGG
ncbi:hypothetical protein [Vitiosangium sp. GDMCC 1.1324]|uniref:hypothetical protein n=1 Tax=Vitiosangium sp. (strain GDMCC 1.1324) TaxID=2138576 RepID=UPI000D382DC9|nr:hypothetical protein [Vitiosangium sp. GDMCC 1.1324]PTL82265.1 hypothetical protein DAT35_20975 [Vitiosangium sp. GDMCC 1.1324]